MSNVDIERISRKLKSTKIKDRNEGLDALDGLCSLHVLINQKQLEILTLAVFVLVENEKIQFNKSQTRQIEDRISSASNSLKALVKKSIRHNGRLKSVGQQLQVKTKYYVLVIEAIVRHFYIECKELDSYCLDVISIVSMVLEQDFVKEHLNQKSWNLIYLFVVDLIDKVLERSEDNYGHQEKLIIELYVSLHLLILFKSSISSYPLALTSPESQGYLVLYDIVSTTVSKYKKEGLLAVTIFKIVNKLIVVFSTEDVCFANRLTNIGFQLLIRHINTSLTSLLDQLLLFMNLSCVNDYLRSIGESSIIMGSTDKTCQIASNDTSTQHKNSARQQKHDFASAVNIRYNVGKLIQIMISKLETSDFFLNAHAIGIKSPNSKPNDLFQLTSIYLKGHNDRENDRDARAWLFCCALVKTMNAFYDMESSKILDFKAKDSIADDLDSSLLRKVKKQRLDVAGKMHQASNLIEFSMKLILSKENVQYQKIGLQLITFNLELDAQRESELVCSLLNQMNTESFSKSSGLKNDTTRCVSSQSDNIRKFCEQDSILKPILGTFDRSDLTFWSLLLIRSLLKKKVISSGALSFVSQILKILLTLIKQKQYATLACTIVVLIVGGFSNDSLSIILSTSIRIQVENIVDLSEINGPFLIDSPSFKFWYAIAKIIKIVNIPKKAKLQEKIQDWLLSKWTMDKLLDTSVPVESLSSFICWLCGTQAHYKLEEKRFKKYNGSLADFNKLTHLLVFPEHIELASCSKFDATYLESVVTSTNLLEFWIGIGKSNSIYENHTMLFRWALIASSVGAKLEDSQVHSQRALLLKLQSIILFEEMVNSLKLENTALEFYASVTYSDILAVNSSERLSEKMLELVENVVSLLEYCRDLHLHADSFNNNIASDEMEDNEFSSDYLNILGGSHLLNGLEDKEAASKTDIHSNLLEFLLPATKVFDQRIESLFSYIIRILRSSSYSEVARYLYSVTNRIKNVPNLATRLSDEVCIDFLRILGEGPLAFHESDRNEITLLTTSNLLTIITPKWDFTSSEELKRDYSDVSYWLTECLKKNVELTMTGCIGIMNYILCLLQRAVVPSNRVNPEEIFFHKVLRVCNRVKMKLAPAIKATVSYFKVPIQMLFYKKYFSTCGYSQSSKEQAITFLKLLCIFAVSSAQLMVASTYNIIELSKVPHLVPLVKWAVGTICETKGITDVLYLFESMKTELIRSWWVYNARLDDFPYDVFDFESYLTFIASCYKDVVAICLSFKHDHTHIMLLVERILSATMSDDLCDISDCIPLSISLAFSEDGVRNEVFARLRELLKDKYNTEMCRTLPLMIREILFKVDVSKINEVRSYSNLLASLKLFKSDDEDIEHFDLNTITFKTALNLIQTLIKKFHKLQENFWTLPVFIFIIRLLEQPLKSLVSSHDVKINLRRIKVVVTISPENAFNFESVKLITNAVSPILDDHNHSNDVLDLLSVLKLEELIRDNAILSIPLVVLISDSLVKIDEQLDNDKILFFTNSLKILLSMFSLRSIRYIFDAIFAILRGESLVLESSYIEKFLSNDDDVNLCKQGQSFEKLKSLIAKLFKHINVFNDEFKSIEVVKFIVGLSSESAEQSEEYKRWCTDYIANFSIKVGIKNGIPRNLHYKDSYLKVNTDYFNRTSNLNFLLHEVEHVLDHSDPLEVQISEYYLGELLQKFNDDRNNFTKYMNLQEYLIRHESYVLQLDIFTYRNVRNMLGIKSLIPKNILQALHLIKNKIHTVPLTESIRVLFCSILIEAVDYKYITEPTLDVCDRVEEFSIRAFPYLICYVIHSGEKISEIIEIISFLIQIKKPSLQLVQLIMETILLIRVGFKETRKNFVEVFLKVDIGRVYALAVEFKLSKVALILLEDEVSDLKKCFKIENYSKVLSDIYSSIDNDDLMIGLPEETSLEYAITMLRTYSDTSEKLRFSGGILDSSLSLGLEQQEEIFENTKDHGLLGISQLVSGSESEVRPPQDDLFETSWKLNTWNLPAPQNPRKEHEVYYSVLKQIHDYPVNAEASSKSRLLEYFSSKDDIIKLSSTEKDLRKNLEEWFITITSLSNINEIVACRGDQFATLESVFYGKMKGFKETDSMLSESVLLTRKVLFQILGDCSFIDQFFTRDESWLGAFHGLLKLNELYINSNELQKMISSMIMLNDIHKHKLRPSSSLSVPNLESSVKYQTAYSLWKQGHSIIPVKMLKEILLQGELSLPIINFNVPSSLVKANLIEWMAQSRQDLASNIMQNHVLSAATEVTKVKDLEQQATILGTLADFCESQYKSPSLNEKIRTLSIQVDLKKNEIDEMKLHYGKTAVAVNEKKRIQKYYAKLKLQYAAEQTDLEILQSNLNAFLERSVDFYLKSVLTNHSNDEMLDKFFALWLEHSSNEKLNQSIRTDLTSISSYNLVAWSTQLISRLTNESSTFQTLVESLIVKLCADHPYHSLYSLMSLRMHEGYARDGGKLSMPSKSTAATRIWKQILQHGNPRLTKTLSHIETFCTEAVALAEYKYRRGKTLNLCRFSGATYWIDDLPPLPPPTAELAIDQTTRYASMIVMTKINQEVAIATSGLSMPKIVTFNLSDGSEHKMLFKSGTDDLRQDSIMEQVFEKVNNIFCKDKNSRKRNLRIRTYKAVPLGPEAGVIGFVPNSIALIDVIKPYHADSDRITLDAARQMMKSCEAGDKLERLMAYHKITQSITPVMRHFFFDNYLSPEKWFSCRTSYTRGVATTSLVGHILGLGDRHCNNILMDKSLGEPIHIDFGVAFDQGKRLPIPETVPFRLTRDIVDGFGITGVNGVFNEACKHTFRVLRSNQKHILAILDVLRWDPLYCWTVSPVRRKKLQNNEEENANFVNIKPEEDGSEGSRAMLLVSDKLTAGGLSVEAVIRELVQEATSPQNLALIYFGWCPFF